MKFKLINTKDFENDIIYQDSICFGIFNEDKKINSLLLNNEYVNNLINRELKNKKIYENILLYDIPNTNIKKLLIILCGDKKKFEDYEYKNIIKKYIKIIKENNICNSTCFLTNIDVKNKNIEWKIKITSKIIRDEIYSFSKFKSIKNKNNIKNINLIIDNEDLNKLNNFLYESEIISDAIDISKDLSNLPANICNAYYLYEKCNELSNKNKNITLEYLDSKKMKELGMNAYLSVSMGSNNEPIMSILKYNGYDNSNKYSIALIGKGLTFDTGGISLKQAKDMDYMKFDMCGAASVYGTIYAINKLNLPINVVGIIASCENSIGSTSYRPGDIIKTLSGKTVEVLNTDAEGRLVLCDAISYSYKYNPSIIIDIATLTGACSIALGEHFSGLISNNKDLYKDIIKSSKEIDDKVWRLPLIKEHQNQINSNIADIKNIGDGNAGTITAGCFLFNFIKKDCKWAHLDIAGTAYSKDKKATGRPIYLLTQFLINKSKY